MVFRGGFLRQWCHQIAPPSAIEPLKQILRYYTCLERVPETLDISALQLGSPFGIGSLHLLGRRQRELAFHEERIPAALGLLRREDPSQQLEEADEGQGRVGQVRREHILVQAHFVLFSLVNVLVQERKCRL